MSSNYQQKKMMNALGAIDTKGNIVLEQFQRRLQVSYRGFQFEGLAGLDARLRSNQRLRGSS